MKRQTLVKELRSRIGDPARGVSDEKLLELMASTGVKARAELALTVEELRRAACAACGIPADMMVRTK